MRKIGITGGIGSGKSKVLDFLSVVRGAVICQSDLVAHQVQLPGEKCYLNIRVNFSVSPSGSPVAHEYTRSHPTSHDIPVP